jgi:glycine cleavage system T protein (aminomethyltransferase)
MTEDIKSAFYGIQERMGATFVPEGGWFWTDTFGDLSKEYRAPRETVGMWDVSPLNKWDWTGPDAVRAAQRLHSNDILGMEVGQVKYGAFLDPNGLMVDDGTVFKLADDHVWVMTNGMERREYFEEHVGDMDVTIDYKALEMPHLQVQGPRSRDLVQSLTDTDISGLRYFRFLPEQITVGNVPVWLSRTGFSGELGYELFVRPEGAEDLWAAVQGAGAVPYGVGVIEQIRVETGMIVTDYDYESHTRTPYDFNLDRVVALDTGGEFLGKQRLRGVSSNPPNRFKTLRLDGSELPEYGATITRDGEEVGVLTSPADSPAFGPIGLAILRADVVADGGKVDVAMSEGTIGATVDGLAIYDPEKRKPRG